MDDSGARNPSRALPAGLHPRSRREPSAPAVHAPEPAAPWFLPRGEQPLGLPAQLPAVEPQAVRQRLADVHQVGGRRRRVAPAHAGGEQLIGVPGALPGGQPRRGGEQPARLWSGVQKWVTRGSGTNPVASRASLSVSLSSIGPQTT